MKSIVALLAVFALVVPGAANAASSEGADTYIGLQFGNSDVSVDGISDLDFDLTLLQVGVWGQRRHLAGNTDWKWHEC